MNLKPESIANTLLLLTLIFAAPVLTLQSTRAEAAALENMADGTVRDIVSGKLWRLERSDRRYRDVQKAEDYLAQLESDTGLSWRLPTKDEFSDLYEIFDLKRNKETSMQLDGNYWFMNKNGKPAVGAWESGVGCGPVRDFYLKKKGYVRAISDPAS